MPSTWFYYRCPKSTIEKYARIYPKAIPSVKVPVRPKRVRHIEDGKRTDIVRTPNEQRLTFVGQYVTQLFREERIEMRSHNAGIIRPYAERLIQMAIEYGDCHKPTMEICNYFLNEKDLIHKLFKVFVPRYRNCATAYTSIYQLPTFYGPNPNPGVGRHDYVLHHPIVLEMKGHPYPPVITKPEEHRNSLLNVLLDSARKHYALEKRQMAEQREPKTDKLPASGDSDSPSKVKDTARAN